MQALLETPAGWLTAVGIVFAAINAARAEEVIAIAETLAAREAAMAEAVRSGRSVVEVMGASYESMLEQPA